MFVLSHMCADRMVSVQQANELSEYAFGFSVMKHGENQIFNHESKNRIY